MPNAKSLVGFAAVALLGLWSGARAAGPARPASPKKSSAKSVPPKTRTAKAAAAKAKRSPSTPKVARTVGPQPERVATKTQAAAKPKSAARRPVARRRQPAPVRVSTEARLRAVEAVTAWLDVPSSIENPAALVPFLERLYRLSTGALDGPVRILHYGDSHTASDDWPGTLRYLFQTRFGDGGPGFSHAGRPWSSYRRYDVRSWASSGWRAEGLVGRQGDGIHGLSGVSITATRPREVVTLDATCLNAELYYLQQPGGGAFELSVDGGEAQPIETGGETAPGFVRIPLEAGSHRFEVRTQDHRPVRLFGWTAENSTGITYETLGINGAQASMLLATDLRLLASHLQRRDPALIVVAYGTNEAGNKEWTLESYRQSFSELLAGLRHAVPAASILVVGPPDRYIRSRGQWTVMDRVDMVIQAQRQAALEARCAFFDLRERMGGKGSMRNWVYAGMAQPDFVHFTGSGYRLLAAALYKDIAGQYEVFAKVRSAPADPPVTEGGAASEQARSNH